MNVHRIHPRLDGEKSQTHREEFCEVSLQEHFQLPVVDLEPVPLLAGVAWKILIMVSMAISSWLGVLAAEGTTPGQATKARERTFVKDKWVGKRQRLH